MPRSLSAAPMPLPSVPLTFCPRPLLACARCRERTQAKAREEEQAHAFRLTSDKLLDAQLIAKRAQQDLSARQQALEEAERRLAAEQHASSALRAEHAHEREQMQRDLKVGGWRMRARGGAGGGRALSALPAGWLAIRSLFPPA